jgi:zinc transport system substrate-binding protein
MPFMDQAEAGANKQLLIDAKDRNWMAPYSYVAGLRILAGLLMDRFPEHKQKIATRRERAIQEVTAKEKALSDETKRAGISQRPIIASSMLREPLEWMGFCVVGQYGRPESISAKEIANLIHIGKEKGVVLIVDNLQSGPEAGKGIAEALAIPHVILSNFPSEKGYAATLSENVAAMLAAVRTK